MEARQDMQVATSGNPLADRVMLARLNLTSEQDTMWMSPIVTCPVGSGFGVPYT